MSLPDEIERVALLGWCVYPMSRHSKAGCFKGASDAATHDLDTLETWAREFPDCNWRVVMGPSRLFALDVDRPGTHEADGFSALRALVAEYGPLPPRPMTRTGGSGGAVLFFRHNLERLRGQSGYPAPGLDPHRGRQAIVIPPSRHPVTQGHYTWRRSCAPWEIDTPPIPGWLSKMMEPPPEPVTPCGPFVPTAGKARNALMRAMTEIENAPSGAGNVTLNRQAFRIGRWCGAGLLSEYEAQDAILYAASRRNIPRNEARDTTRSGIRAGMKNPIQERMA